MIHKWRKSGAALAAMAILVLTVGSAIAQGSDDAQSRVSVHNVSADGVALEGHSPVSYFTVGRAVRGSAAFSATHDGVTYYLASESEQEAFRADPDRYAPAYGGWCAYGLAINELFPIDPESFKIVDGRLMLFLRSEAADALVLWNSADEQQQVNSADANWAAMSQ